MKKTDKDLKTAQNKANRLTAFLNNTYDKIYCKKLDINQKKIPIWQKAINNTIVGRRGITNVLSSVMGVTIKITLKKTQKYILVEPRYGQTAFRSTYVKLPSGHKSNGIFLDTTAMLIVDLPECRYYALYEYEQVPESHITKGGKGQGNANRCNLNSINATPIPINGLSGPLVEPGLEKALINLIKKIGK